MDLTEYLWARVERGDGVGLLVRALNTPPIRDALLRHAARTGQWEPLRTAALAAADAAAMAGWSSSGPQVVAGLCHWMAADQLLSAVPAGDRAEGLAGAVRQSWTNPVGVAAAIAASPALDESAAELFNDELVAESTAGPGAELLVVLGERLGSDPALVAAACDHPAVRDALLRAAARSGRWEQLEAAAAGAAGFAALGGADPAGPTVVAAVCGWVRGDPDARDKVTAATGNVLADLVLTHWDNPAGAVELFANSPLLADGDALDFTAQRRKNLAGYVGSESGEGPGGMEPVSRG